MLALRSLGLRLGLGLSLALATGGLVTGCTPPAKTATAKKSPEKKKKQNRPKDPWLDGVLASAEVTVKSDDGKSVKCAWDAGKKRHLCPGQKSWVYVGPQVLKVGDKQEYCVWQHPADGAKVTTTLKGIASQPLELKHAFAGASAGVREAAPVEVVLRIDGEERAKVQRLREPGFSKVRLEPAKDGKPGDLQIQVSASHVGVAHFCWQLKKLGGDKPAVATAPDGTAAEGTATTPDVKAASASVTDAKATDAKATDAKATDKKAADAKATDVKATATPTPAQGKVRRGLKGPLGVPTTPAVPRKPLQKPAGG